MNSPYIKKISFVIPVYNEEKNILPLYLEVSDVINTIGHEYEIIFINDCSTDTSFEKIISLAQTDRNVHYLSLPHNCGQSAALAVGFAAAQGDVIITMDADLQNDPADIPHMLSYYGKYDMVTGWRYNRKDTYSKKIASKIGNTVRNIFTGDTIHDTGCSLKIMRSSLVKRIKIYHGLHRFLPTLMRIEGASILEYKVNHRNRMYGQSKYTNFKRGIEGFYDLLAVRWMIKRNLSLKIKDAIHE